MLLVFSAGMATARPVLLAGGLIILMVLYLLSGNTSPRMLLTMVRRLRWLLLAILLVYGWWTPGTILWPAAGALSPTIEGLTLGLLRATALLAIIAAVNLLLQGTPREQLLPAIMQLIRPFTSRQLRERIAVRSLLAIESVAPVQTIATDILRQHPPGERQLSKLAAASQRLYQSVLERAAQDSGSVIEVYELAAPPWWQWLLPLALAVAIVISF